MDELKTGPEAEPRTPLVTIDMGGPHPRMELSVDALRIEIDGVLYRLTLTPPEVDAGRCTARLNPNALLDVLGAGVPVEARQPESWCDLRAGHTGCHRDQSTGAEWTPLTRDQFLTEDAYLAEVRTQGGRPAEPVRSALDELAAVFKAHNFDRMTCLNHADLGAVCDPAGCHGVEVDQYRHYAEVVQAHSSRISPAIQDVAAERATHAGRGWTAEHDAKIGVDTLIELSGRYAIEALRWTRVNPLLVEPRFLRSRLVKAASLLVAAIELLDAIESERS